MPFAKVDIAGGQVSGVSALSSAPSSVVNFDVDEAGANWPRAALTTYTVTGLRSEPINGLYRWGYHIIVTFTSGHWQAISDYNPTTAINLSDSTTNSQLVGGKRPTFVGGNSYVYATAGNKIRRWKPSLLVAEIMSSSPRCTHIASLGQYLIANDLDDDDALEWSDIGEGAWGTWPAANTTNPSAKPDPIIGLTATLDELHVFGTETTQIYQVGSDPTLPFDLVRTQNLGVEAPYAFTEMDEGISKLDHRRRILLGQSPISDAIQKDIRSLSNVSDAFAYRVERGQFAHQVWRFPTANRTFVYDLKAQRWAEYQYYEAPFQVDYPVGAYVYWPALNKHMVGGEFSTGGLFYLDDTTRTENSTVPVVATRTTGHHDFGSVNRKRFGRVRVVLKRGTSSTSTVSSQGALEVRVQDDESDWSDWEQQPLGDVSQFENVVDIWGLAGVGRRRRFELRYSSSEETNVAEVYQEYQEVAA